MGANLFYKPNFIPQFIFDKYVSIWIGIERIFFIHISLMPSKKETKYHISKREKSCRRTKSLTLGSSGIRRAPQGSLTRHLSPAPAKLTGRVPQLVARPQIKNEKSPAAGEDKAIHHTRILTGYSSYFTPSW